GVYRCRQGRPGRQRRGRLRARRGHDRDRPGGDARHRLHPGAAVPRRPLPHRRGHPEHLADAGAGPDPEVRPVRQLRPCPAPRAAEDVRGVRGGPPGAHQHRSDRDPRRQPRGHRAAGGLRVPAGVGGAVTRPGRRAHRAHGRRTPGRLRAAVRHRPVSGPGTPEPRTGRRWTADLSDPALPVVGDLLAEGVPGPLAAVVAATGGTVGAARLTEVTWWPGRSVTVTWDVVVTGGPLAGPGSFVATTVAAPEGAVVVGDGSSSVAVWRVPHDPFLPALPLALQ